MSWLSVVNVNEWRGAACQGDIGNSQKISHNEIKTAIINECIDVFLYFLYLYQYLVYDYSD